MTPGGVLTNLYSFGTNPGDGRSPSALLQGADGNFYGTTLSGGAQNQGTVFEISPAGAFTTLYSFGSVPGDGAAPLAALIQAGDGTFYGTTQNGNSSNTGTIFQITSSGTETVFYTFGMNLNDGLFPQASLVLGSDGNFYGTTNQGGTQNQGAVFQITPAGVEMVLYSLRLIESRRWSEPIRRTGARQ